MNVVIQGEEELTAVIRGQANMILEQRDRIAQLEGLLGMRLALPPALPIESYLLTLLGMLLECRAVLSKEMIYDALYGGRPEDKLPTMKIIDVQMCNLRKALNFYADKKALGPIVITTFWGRGYFIDAENKNRVRQLIEAYSS